MTERFVGTYRPDRRTRRLTAWERFVVDRFHRLTYSALRHAFPRVPSAGSMHVSWLGHQAIKSPLDLWVYQELITEIRPDFIVETGTFRGGSAFYLASIMDLVDHGHVLTIDIEDYGGRPKHPRIDYLSGSSTDPKIVGTVLQRVAGAQSVMVILDSDHSQGHVAAELAAYAEMVTPGSYLIVEDTNVNGHPVAKGFGPGPTEAVRDFLRGDSRFEADRGMERFLLTLNPNGYLRRVR